MNYDKINITFDPEGVYSGEVSSDDLISDFLDSLGDSSVADWIKTRDKDVAVAFIANAWGLKFDFVQEKYHVNYKK